MTKALLVYLHQRLCGYLHDVGNARIEFIYDDDYLQNTPIALSNSLPLTQRTFNDQSARAFFSGLLPDDSELDRLARYLKTSKQNTFKLLAQVGGECAGAVSLYDEAPKATPRIQQPVLDESKLEKILISGRNRPMLGGDDKVRLSLAGAQSKLAVIIQQKQVRLSSETQPSTHILKPPSAHIGDLVQNEFFCMQLAGAVGIAAPKTEIRKIGTTLVYQVERYDRLSNSGTTNRLHQEDFCQALGIAPENKYQHEGGPSLEDCIELIQNYSTRPAVDYQQLLDRVIFNYLIGNNDAHAKNFSILYQNSNTRLAPAYDLVCTAVYPDLNHKMAMKIGGRYDPKDLQRRHWERLVPNTQTSKKALHAQIRSMTDSVRVALESHAFLENTFQHPSSIVNGIIELVGTRIDSLNKLL